MQYSTLALVSICAICTACVANDGKLNELQKKVQALETDRTILSNDRDLINARLDALEESVSNEARPTSASFGPDQKGYSPIHTSYGVFLVSLADLKPYANGYKATFNFGNLFSMSFENVEVELRWGPQRPADFKTIKYTDWQKQFRTSKQKISRRLQPGSWNPVELVLAPANANDVGEIDITSLATDRVFLAQR